MQRGAQIDYLEVYRRIKPSVDGHTLIQALVANQLDVIVVTSAEALENLLDLAGENIAMILNSIPLVVISHRIQIKADKLGFSQIWVSDEPSDVAIVKIIKALLSEE